MKHQGFVDINKPIEQVSKLFLDPEIQKEYQDGFIKKEMINGVYGEKGSVAMLYFNHRGRDMELNETIVSNNLPSSFETYCRHKHMENTMKCRFEKLSDNQTRYHYAVEYTKVFGFMPKLMMKLMPGMFRKPVDKWMHQFKAAVEKR